MFFRVITLHKILFSKMILVKTYSFIQLQQPNWKIDFIFQKKVQKKDLMILFLNILWTR